MENGSSDCATLLPRSCICFDRRAREKGVEGEVENWEKVYPPCVRVQHGRPATAVPLVGGKRKNSETMEASKRHVNQNGNKSIFKCGRSLLSPGGFGSQGAMEKPYSHTNERTHPLAGVGQEEIGNSLLGMYNYIGCRIARLGFRICKVLDPVTRSQSWLR